MHAPFAAAIAALTMVVTGLAANGTAAADAPPSAEELLRMPPRYRIEYIRQLRERQRLAATPSATSNEALAAPFAVGDTTPPVLTAFNAGTVVNAAQATAQLTVNLTITDDLSGFAYVFVDAVGPSGQFAGVIADADYPSQRFVGRLAVDFHPFTEPGAWTIVYVSGMDAAGNVFGYESGELALLGNYAFTVNNTQGGDTTPPVLTEGRILTPNLSLSTPPPGTVAGTPPFAGVAVTVTDTGTDGSRVAGVHEVSLGFCGDAENGCIYLTAETDKYGQLTARLEPGIQLLGGVPSQYSLTSAYISDWAGNSTELDAAQLSALFSTTEISVTE